LTPAAPKDQKEKKRMVKKKRKKPARNADQRGKDNKSQPDLEGGRLKTSPSWEKKRTQNRPKLILEHQGGPEEKKKTCPRCLQ